MAYLYAAGYYPNMHAPEEVEHDLDTMQKCGIRVIRTAELFNGWDQTEPERGRFDFTVLDRFFEQCAARGIGILLGTGTASPPYWLHELDPDMNILSSTGQRFPNQVTYSWACVHNPAYLRESERYIRTLVGRYCGHPALFGYQIHNEIGLPFMSPSGSVEMYCYCEHTKAAFRRWVQKKYGTLEKLNEAWRWSATNNYHYSWDMVEPPYAKPTAWSSVTKYLDFRLFMMDSITDFVHWQHTLIRSMDAQHPTSTNTFYMKGEDKMSVMCAIDQFALAKAVDFIGYDLYPGSSNKQEDRPEFVSMFLDHARSISRPLGHDYWLTEVESGPINGWALGPHRDTSAGDIRRYILEALGHDAKMTLYQGFRQWDFQPINWGGLVDLDGRETPRTDAAAEMGRFCAENGAWLNRARTPKGEAALLVSRENAILANGLGHESFLVQSLRAHYSLFWQLGYQVDFITPELLESGYADDYRVISAPFLLSADEALLQALARYVRQGGILLGEPRLGYLDGRGWYQHRQPAGVLAEVFGVEQTDIAHCTPMLTWRGQNYEGSWHKQTLRLCGAQALARFYDDTPAVTRHAYGSGCALYFGTHAALAWLEKGSRLAPELLRSELERRGVQPQLQVEYANREGREIDPHLLRGEDRSLLILTVFVRSGRSGFFPGGHRQADVTLREPSAVCSVCALPARTAVPFSQQDGVLRFSCGIAEGEQPVWEIRYAEKQAGPSDRERKEDHVFQTDTHCQ